MKTGIELLGIEDLNLQDVYKVCQITIKGEPLMYFVKDARGICHKNILIEILKLNNLPCPPEKAPGDEGWIYCSGDAVAYGMGGARMLPQKNLMLFSDSIDYVMSISENHKNEFAEKNKKWTLEIRSLGTESLAS